VTSGSVLTPSGDLPEGPEKRRAVEEMFDRVAPGYDRMNRIISLGRDTFWRRRTVGALGLPRGSLVLDLACGTGDLSCELAEAGYRPIGIDFSARMLELAATRTEAPLVRGDAQALPLHDGAVDGVVCGFALRNFVDVQAVFAECSRILRPGGRVAALDAAVPERLVMRAGNSVWFRGAVPVLGRLLARNAEAYRYLPRSTAYLPPPRTLLDQLHAAGFAGAARRTMTGGSVQLITGTRL
jgi:demethylmenaquinone methyltransferase/2-methoxy-6-polyprenyl-1,4-benzoquinol methylase